MDAIQGSGRLPRLEGGFNVITARYLTVVLPGDKAMLTAREAIELSAPYPCARWHRQLPLRERVLVNDLYGMPLYQRAERNLKAGQSPGVLAAAAVTEAMGADPNFIFDQAVIPPSGSRGYEMEHQPRRNPGLVRYVCRGEDCRAFGTARFGFTMEDEFVSHWNTFHVAVIPQFVSRHPGCRTTFVADPGTLDRFLDSHIMRRRKEEAATSVPHHCRHQLLPDSTSLELSAA